MNLNSWGGYVKDIEYDTALHQLYFQFNGNDACLWQKNQGIEFDGIYAEEFVDFLNDCGYEITLIAMAVNWKCENIFLTQKDAENHLRNNEHHYSSDAYTYCQTGWRSPRYEKLIKLIETVDWDKLCIIGIDLGKME